MPPDPFREVHRAPSPGCGTLDPPDRGRSCTVEATSEDTIPFIRHALSGDGVITISCARFAALTVDGQRPGGVSCRDADLVTLIGAGGLE